MEKLNSLCLLLILCTFWLSLAVAADSESSTTINYLPGFHGPLPFYLETGYIGIGEAEEVQLFYYFVKSERNPDDDPLLLWLTGGPGCSAFSGLAFEIGPLRFEVAEYNGSLPALVYNPDTWTKVSSIIFVDLPVRTGFSYATTMTNSSAVLTSDLAQVSHAEEFLRKWLRKHSEFISNPLYIAGDSYSGITLPAIVQRLSVGNENGIQPMLNLKGYMIGNPVTGGEFDNNAQIPFAHGMALISDELYQGTLRVFLTGTMETFNQTALSLEESCGGEYQSVDPTNLECVNNLKAFRECLSGIQPGSILDPICGFSSRKPMEIAARRKILQDKPQLSVAIDPPEFGCSFYSYLLCTYWADDEQVRKALHIREGTVGDWVRCNHGLGYVSDIPSSFKYHVYLSAKGYRSLIYSGDHDMVVPFMGTQTWIRALNYSVVEDWRSWHVEGQVAGYTRTYSNGMTYATVKGGMHTAPESRSTECSSMFVRWINHEPL